MIKQLLSNLYRFYYRLRVKRGYYDLYDKISKCNCYKKANKLKAEDAWMQNWRRLDKNITPKAFRIFSKYIGEDINIIPLETAAFYIDHCLNPAGYVPYLDDKNLFDKLLPDGYLPKTILRNMNGFFYRSDYSSISVLNDPELFELLNGYESVIIKPATNSGSGSEVRLFRLNKKQFIDKSGLVINKSMLDDIYGEDYIIQECVKQSEFMDSLNDTSVNTIRVMLYRSVKNDTIKFCNAILRIGKNGSDVDNAHAGGKFCGISQEGVLGKYVCDFLGHKDTVFNNIDFSAEVMQIPNYERIKEFAVNIGERIPYMRLLALDIMIDQWGNPKLIEYNNTHFSYWFFQFTNGSAYGDYTDEVIDYCIKRHKEMPMKMFSI